MKEKTITIVSGLPRSGTSMMMMMLQAGGMETLTDNIRKADEDNPKGYYEFERVKDIEHDTSWLPLAEGKVVKMISALLRHLPDDYEYKVVFMQRKMEEILASQRRMLIRRGEDPDAVSDDKIAEISRRHLQQVEEWLHDQPNIGVLYVRYNEVLDDPRRQATRISGFLDGRVDPVRMVQAVDKRLYRQRA
ncbi:MAG TPA: sulfotransferase family protein [Candidatus Acetothermia bacterium]|nr:sulfotransferase family protein [Candidatus Acetothermia bacterium]HEX32114.1 sulfotransferase family protein [Candidatus Acetothermia bacterium]